MKRELGPTALASSLPPARPSQSEQQPLSSADDPSVHGTLESELAATLHSHRVPGCW